MKKTCKRILSLALALVMVLGLLAGCAGSNDEPIVITVFSELANYSGEQMGWSAKLLKEKFNVVLNIIPSADGVYETRMESGFLGDIVVWGSNGENYTRALEAGLLYDWNEDNLVQEYGPDIYANMKQALDANAAMTAEITATRDADGNIVTLGEAITYGFGHNVSPSADDHESFFYNWDIRWDLYKQLGYPEIKNMDDLLQVLIDMKEICPTDDNGNETYGVSLWPDWDGDMAMYVKSFATSYWGYDELGIGVYDPATGTYYDALSEGGPYLQSLKFFNQLYQNGLVDPNSMTQTYENMYEKVQAGGVFFSVFNFSGSLGFNTEKHLAENKYMGSLVPTEAKPIVYGMSTTGGNRIWSIGSNAENPELCMEIINWLCTPEGVMTYNYGPKDLCWYYDEEGYTHFTEFGLLCKSDRSTPMSEEWGGGTFNDGCIQINNTTWTVDAVNPDSAAGERFNCEFWKSYQLEAKNEMEQDWRDFTGAASVEEYMETSNYTVSPATTFKQGSKTGEFKTTWSAVTEVITTKSWQAIYAETDADFDAIVAQMIQEANSYGYEECLNWSLDQAAQRRALELEVTGG